jgi:hypothetical protein
LRLRASSSSTRLAQRSSITVSATCRRSGGPPARSHLLIVSGWRPTAAAMSVIVQPWRRNATTSMNSSWVIISVAPSVLRCLVARHAEGALAVRVGPAQEPQELNWTRTSLIVVPEVR